MINILYNLKFMIVYFCFSLQWHRPRCRTILRITSKKTIWYGVCDNILHLKRLKIETIWKKVIFVYVLFLKWKNTLPILRSTVERQQLVNGRRWRTPVNATITVLTFQITFWLGTNLLCTLCTPYYVVE